MNVVKLQWSMDYFLYHEFTRTLEKENKTIIGCIVIVKYRIIIIYVKFQCKCEVNKLRYYGTKILFEGYAQQCICCLILWGMEEY